MKIFHKFSKVEKLVIILLLLVVFSSASNILYNYFKENSISYADFGGTYSESLVGEVNFINPVFSNLNKIDKDIGYFLFRGLMKFRDGKILEDVGTYTLSEDKKTYVFKIKDNVFWHDGKKMTINDVYYTYRDVLQSDEFENKNLGLGLHGVEITKKGDDEIIFKLQKPYKFFLSNLITGILPEHILAGIPIRNLKYSEFNFENPIGLGPYKLVGIKNFGTYKKISLTKNRYFYDKSEKYFIENIEFLIYKNDLLQKNDVDNFLGFGPVQKNLYKNNNDKKSELFGFDEFVINQRKSVGLFLNTESKFLKNAKTRLGLQLGIDKKNILQEIGETKNINTPFLTIKNDWTLSFYKDKARGSLYEAGWKFPKKIEIKKKKKKNFGTKFVFSHNKTIFATGSGSFYLEGTVPEGTVDVFMGQYQLKNFKRNSKTFSYKMDVKLGTLKEGENNFVIRAKLKSGDEKFLDVMKIFYFKDKAQVVSKQAELSSKSFNGVLKEIEDKEKIKKNLNLAKKLHFRVNEEGEIFKLKLITEKKFLKYSLIAENLKKDLGDIGVDLDIEYLNHKDFVEKLNNKDYDILLYGQYLGYNLDIYPFFHSSEAGFLGSNFSNLKDPEFDILIEKIRGHDNKKEDKKKKLDLLENRFKKIIPAIYLYSPNFYYNISKDVKGVVFGEIVNHEDRFGKFNDWYIKEDKKIINNKGFFTWIDEVIYGE